MKSTYIDNGNDKVSVGEFVGFKEMGVEQYGKVVEVKLATLMVEVYDSVTCEREVRPVQAHFAWKEG